MLIQKSVLANREKGTGKQGERYYVTIFGRPPLSIGASGLISWSERANICERTVKSYFYIIKYVITLNYCILLVFWFKFWPVISNRLFWDGISQLIEFPEPGLIPVIPHIHRQILIVLRIRFVRQKESVFAFLDDVCISWLYIKKNVNICNFL